MPDIAIRCKDNTTEFAVFLDSQYGIYCCGLGLESKKVDCRYLKKAEINGVILDVCLRCYIGDLESGLQNSILQAA